VLALAVAGNIDACYSSEMKIIVTAGPTREFIDPVRFLSNRSSGKMGFAIAAALLANGHEVILISGPVGLQAPEGANSVSVVSADDMLQAVKDKFEWCDALVMAAAVADWRPERVAEGKIKKADGPQSLDLVSTADILKELIPLRGSQIVAGFAAETGDPKEEGMRKLKEKHLDVLFANDVSVDDAGFDVDTNRIVRIDASGLVEEWPLMSKLDAGVRIAGVLEVLHETGRA
jgi:phosphopantothenoylcysteine decarboxylase/phosphopantothenate--cysteine ligase